MDGKLARIVEGFPRKSILVIGDLMLDTYVEGEVTRINPEAPVAVLKISSTFNTPGGAANTAKNLRKLGANVILSGVIGEDDNGKVLLKQLAEMGIDCCCLVVDPSRPTIEKKRFISMKQQLIRVDSENTQPVGEGIAKQVFAKIQKSIRKADVVVVSDYAKGLLEERLIKAIIRLARDCRKPIVVDPKPHNFRFYNNVTLIKPNLKEAKEITVKNGDNRDAFVEEIGLKLMRDNNSGIVITRGDKGMSLFEKSGKVTHVPARKVEISDVSGAGDTVTAALALGVASGLSLVEAVELANQAASIKVTKFGTATVSPEELKSMLREGITSSLKESILVKQSIIETQLGIIEDITHSIIKTYINKKKILVFGNGGSASDAMHMTGELVGRFKMERKGFAAISLPSDTATLTAIGNDYGFEHVFEREIEALGNGGDLAIAFTTSGDSPNIIMGLKKARQIGMRSVVFTGKDGGRAKEISDLCIIVPLDNTPRIQEAHIAIVHIICELLENEIYKGGGKK